MVSLFQQGDDLQRILEGIQDNEKIKVVKEKLFNQLHKNQGIKYTTIAVPVA